MASDLDPRPTLVLNPADDPEFRAAAEGAVAGRSDGADGLQERLRVTYADAIVRPRELAGEQVQIWYVYRDGHWVKPANGRRGPEELQGKGGTP